MLQLLFFALEEAIKLEPGIAQEIQTLLGKGNPSPADWQALRSRVTANPYEKFDPAPINVPVTLVQSPAAAVSADMHSLSSPSQIQAASPTNQNTPAQAPITTAPASSISTPADVVVPAAATPGAATTSAAPAAPAVPQDKPVVYENLSHD